jgi:hypothetical protein
MWRQRRDEPVDPFQQAFQRALEGSAAGWQAPIEQARLTPAKTSRPPADRRASRSPGRSAATSPPPTARTAADAAPSASKLLLCIPSLWHVSRRHL